jgi:AraC-like DNA-binding protein
VPHLDTDTIAAPAFCLADDLTPGGGAWHAHRHHQLLYAAAGMMWLEIDTATWMLPPQRAAWIAGGVRHRVVVRAEAALRTVYLAPELTDGPGATCRVFPVTPLAREMLLYSARWGPQDGEDPTARSWFSVLAALCGEWSASEHRFCLPRARSEQLARALEWALEHLQECPTVQQVARAGGMSTRTLSRRFAEETGMTWRAWLHHARMMHAMELLLRPDATVTDTAFQVGFQSLGAFSRAFATFTGQRPSQWSESASDGGILPP